ncbi:MAG: NPCBM/NEW2 domain-containing protein [Verrucomicrobia bacterium]|nr:NPCBM/NEW2 domain-containing protein [Verrucomicrobiota bacterium]
MNMIRLLSGCAGLLFAAALSLHAAEKKIVFVAGKPSHGSGAHEHNAGSLLLKKCLEKVPGVSAEVHLNGWPTDETILDGADAIVLYMDGGARHPILEGDRLTKMEARMKRGVGLALVHYAVEPTIEKGQGEFLNWIGGAFEINWSVNPHWDADFKTLPKHPITRGVKPFQINDEWYFNMRFQKGLKGVTPILSAVAPASTMSRGDGHHSGNPDVRASVKRGDQQHVAWAYDRPDGGRGFGFTGAHFHNNWGNDDFRKLVLNAILWVAKADIPKNGVESEVTPEDLEQNLDPKGQKKPPANPAPVNENSAARPKFTSGLVTYNRVPVDVDISGAKKLWLVVTDGGNSYNCDWADWCDPQLVRADGSIVNLTSLKWTSATTGWGTIGIDKNVKGEPLKIANRVYKTGLGTHAPSIIEYDLPEGFVRFQAKVGIDAGGTEQSCEPAVEFLVFTEAPPSNVLLAKPDVSALGETYGPKAAREALKFLDPAEDLEVTLFASEPMLRNPTNIDIDERGRIWVAEAVNYRSSFKPWGTLDPAGDRIVILEDTNGDGVADVSKVFYQDPKMSAPLGICVLGRQVIVSASPEIFILTDTDGDDKADKKEVLFLVEGFDHDHGIHAMTFGPDGKLYFNFGNEGNLLKRPDGSVVIDVHGNEVSNKNGVYRQALTFRCNLDGSGVEVLGHNFRNPYEVCADSFGTIWQSDNDDDGNRAVRINYVMQGGNYGFSDEMTGASWHAKRTNMEKEIPQRHWYQNDPGVVPNLLVTGAGAPCGMLVYEGRLLPERFRNQMILCDAGPRVVRSHPVTADGAGYAALSEDILSGRDSWFRPSDVCVAPDGSLLVADWNDAGVGGHNMADRSFKEMKGRIYRIAPKGHKPNVPQYDFTKISGAVAALQSPNVATRYLAWDQLVHLGKHAENDLRQLWLKGEPRMRARALQLLARIEGTGERYLRDAAKDGDADIRIAALRIAHDLKVNLHPMLKKLVHDESPQVRRECALLLRGSDSSEAPELWAKLAAQHDGEDRWYLEALGIGAQKNESACFKAWLKVAGKKWNTPAGRDIIWRSRAPEAATYLAKLIADPSTPEEERLRYFRSFDFLKGPEKEIALIELLSLASPGR